MKLYQDDIPSIAKGRVTREEKGNTNKYMLIAIAILAIGAGIAAFVNQVIGMVVLGLAVLVYYWYTGIIEKKTKLATRKLMNEWQADNKEGK